ncbi:hypothetical protein LguiA_020000 [Lonicera macranthoides]
MGSSYFGEPNLGSERSGGRKGKKSSNSDKPKQPQRGLGVAQLEKIRLQTQLGWSHPPYSNLNQQDDMRMQTGYSSSSSFTYTSPSSTSYGFHGHQGVMTGMGELDGDSNPSTNPRWNSPGLETQHFIQPTITTPFFNQDVEGSMGTKKKKERRHSTGSNNQNSESSGSHELDLELRLSI